MIFNRNKLDGRPQIAPNHWGENFKIYYLTEKMRSHADAEFSALCDRVSHNKLTEEDVEYMNSRVRDTDEENNNESFKEGKISIIVTTNKKREHINRQKLEQLLPDEELFACNAFDCLTNVPTSSGLVTCGVICSLLCFPTMLSFAITCSKIAISQLVTICLLKRAMPWPRTTQVSIQSMNRFITVGGKYGGLPLRARKNTHI